MKLSIPYWSADRVIRYANDQSGARHCVGADGQPLRRLNKAERKAMKRAAHAERRLAAARRRA